MPDFEFYDHYYKVTSGSVGGTLTLATSTSRGGGAQFRLTDGPDGTVDGMTALNQNAWEGITGDIDQLIINFRGFTANGDPIFYVDHTNSLIRGLRVYSSSDYPAGTTVASTATGPYTYCFGADTMITTPDGAARVDRLQIGDLVTTQNGSAVRVKWIGLQTVMPFFSGPSALPVIIHKGALGHNRPNQDLTVTADHGIVLDGHIVNASALVNGTSIRFAEPGELGQRTTYYHVETDAHDVVFANGVSAETFVDTSSRANFDNFAEYLDLYGDEQVIAESPLPRIASGRMLPGSIRARINVASAA